MVFVFWIGATIVSLVLNLPTYWSVSYMRQRLGGGVKHIPGLDIILHFIAFFSLLLVSVFPFLLLYVAVIFVYSQSSVERSILFESHMQTYGIRYATIFVSYSLMVYMQENWSLLYHSVGQRQNLAVIYDRPFMQVIRSMEFEKELPAPQPIVAKRKVQGRVRPSVEKLTYTAPIVMLKGRPPKKEDRTYGLDITNVDIYLLADLLAKQGVFEQQVNLSALRFIDIVAVYVTAETKCIILRNGTMLDCPTIFEQLRKIGMDNWVVKISKNYAVNMIFVRYPIKRVADDLKFQTFVEKMLLQNIRQNELNTILRTGRGLRGQNVKQFLNGHPTYSRGGWDALIRI
ncbi:hypothetical protein K7A41_09115 [Sphingobacterium sp. InxBP1]|uniref:hypothetical protein n=1 Tax=Sphingobacterium sp. InxBP1 TaxID=2870328 RepID=UPI002243D650|nr:hypothetical protein [Sphingobacterium sp. InxBP1]MCW8311382.1 hypothetical protein [Sphingobacterium sp. InxBP1]